MRRRTPHHRTADSDAPSGLCGPPTSPTVAGDGDCGQFSDRVHVSYRRRLRDLPLGGQSVVILLRVRRFICGDANCPRRIFAERFAQLTAPYARFTTRLNHMLERVGLAPAGRAGSRLAAQLGVGAGRMTCCAGSWHCRIRSSPRRACTADDFATRRGHAGPGGREPRCGATKKVIGETDGQAFAYRGGLAPHQWLGVIRTAGVWTARCGGSESVGLKPSGEPTS